MIKDIPPQNKDKPKMSVFTNIVWRTLQERKKSCQDREKEEAKLFLFAGDTVLYLENPKESTKAIIRADHQVQQAIQNPSVFLHTSNEPPPQSEIKAIISFTITLKHLGINSIKKQRLACWNYKRALYITWRTWINVKTSYIHGSEDLIQLRGHIPNWLREAANKHRSATNDSSQLITAAIYWEFTMFLMPCALPVGSQFIQ